MRKLLYQLFLENTNIKLAPDQIDDKNALETWKNPRPTAGWSELPKSCPTSTMNFHMAYISWIPQHNARLKLSCKFGESKCNPYWHITLTTSHGMNYVLNEHQGSTLRVVRLSNQTWFTHWTSWIDIQVVQFLILICKVIWVETNEIAFRTTCQKS